MDEEGRVEEDESSWPQLVQPTCTVKRACNVLEHLVAEDHVEAMAHDVWQGRVGHAREIARQYVSTCRWTSRLRPVSKHARVVGHAKLQGPVFVACAVWHSRPLHLSIGREGEAHCIRRHQVCVTLVKVLVAERGQDLV